MNMFKQIIQNAWQEEDGVLTFEWILLLTLVTLGIVSGIAGVRDAFVDELGDITEAAICFDQTFTITGSTTAGIPSSTYSDTKPTFADCGR